MKGQQIGYVRVSSYDQNPERQLAHERLDRTFTDRLTGKDVNRPQLVELISFVREGDTVLVHSMDRLARNNRDLNSLVEKITGKGVAVRFVKEGLIFTGDDSPMSKLLLDVMGAVAEFERALIKERQLEGIAIAKTKGVYKGRKKALSSEQIEDLKNRVAAGNETKTSLASEFGISRETLYQYLRENN